MDLLVKDNIKQLLAALGDEIQQETTDKTFWRFVIKRDNWLINIRQTEKSPFLEVWFIQRYQGDDLIKLKGFAADRTFLLELRKMFASPKIYYYMEIKENEFTGYFVIQRCFIKSDTVDIADLDTAIRSVINYGALAVFFIDSKIRKTIQDQKASDNPSVTLDENKSYS